MAQVVWTEPHPRIMRLDHLLFGVLLPSALTSDVTCMLSAQRPRRRWHLGTKPGLTGEPPADPNMQIPPQVDSVNLAGLNLNSNYLVYPGLSRWGDPLRLELSWMVTTRRVAYNARHTSRRHTLYRDLNTNMIASPKHPHPDPNPPLLSGKPWAIMGH